MNVLLLEDELSVLDILRRTLQRRNYALHEATTAQQALKVGGSMNEHFALLIATVNLHVSSGIEVALQLRAWMPNLKVILISGYPPGSFNDQHAALYNELPSDSVRFLQMPFTPADLLRTVDSFIWVIE